MRPTTDHVVQKTPCFSFCIVIISNVITLLVLTKRACFGIEFNVGASEFKTFLLNTRLGSLTAFRNEIPRTYILLYTQSFLAPESSKNKTTQSFFLPDIVIKNKEMV